MYHPRLGISQCGGKVMHSQHSGSEFQRVSKFEACPGNIKFYFRKERKKKPFPSFLFSPKVINTHTNRSSCYGSANVELAGSVSVRDFLSMEWIQKHKLMIRLYKKKITEGWRGIDLVAIFLSLSAFAEKQASLESPWMTLRGAGLVRNACSPLAFWKTRAYPWQQIYSNKGKPEEFALPLLRVKRDTIAVSPTSLKWMLSVASVTGTFKDE